MTRPQPASRRTWLEVQASRMYGLPPPHRGSPGLGQGPAEDSGHDSRHRRPALSWAPPSPRHKRVQPSPLHGAGGLGLKQEHRQGLFTWGSGSTSQQLRHSFALTT